MGYPENFRWSPGAWFLLGEELLERFSSFALRSLLGLFLARHLALGDSSASTLYHGWIASSYIFSVVSGVATDSYFGKYTSMLAGLVLSAVGTGIFTTASIPPVSAYTLISGWSGLFILSLGSGWIKPCLGAFPGDQFKIPEETKKLSAFYSTFYMTANLAALFAILFAPKLRTIQCLGDDCYLGVFASATALQALSAAIFFAGTCYYVRLPPSGNMLAQVSLCVSHALKRRSNVKAVEKRDHWLDYADDKFDAQLIEDIKAVLRICVLFLPLPLFWALFDQQGSRWTFQASRMRGEIGDLYDIVPDQVQTVNPALILLLLPIFEIVVYPCMDRMNIFQTPLKRLGVGLFLAGLSFLISGVLELEIEKQYTPSLTSYHSKFFFINDVPCPLDINLASGTDMTGLKCPSGAIAHTKIIPPKEYTLTLKLDKTASFTVDELGQCESIMNAYGNSTQNVTVQAPPGAGASMVITWDTIKGIYFIQDNQTSGLDKSREGKISTKIFYTDLDPQVTEIELQGLRTITFPLPTPVEGVTLQQAKKNDKFNIILNPKGILAGSFRAATAGIYFLYVKNDVAKSYVAVEPNTIHMLWQLPQYIVITIAEVFFSVSSLTFRYTMAPDSMKTLIQALWLITVGAGNVLDVVVGEANIFTMESPTHFLFAILMLFDTVLFIFLAYKFKPLVSIGNTHGENNQADEPLSWETDESHIKDTSNKDPAIPDTMEP